MKKEEETSAMFQPGDLVRLKSGSPTLTVSNLMGGIVRCIWYDELKGAFLSEGFNEALLKAAEA